MNTSDTDAMADLIGRKHECLLQLLDLAQRQLGLIDGEHMTDLLNLLAHKQRLLGVLSSLDKQLGRYHGQTPQERPWRSPADRARCSDLHTRCQSLLENILEHERASESRLAARRQQTAVRVHAAYAGHEMHRAYAPDHSVAGQELDLSTEG